MREWNLAEQNHALVRSRQWQVAVLPFGATEPHNLHMPYGTDNFQVDVLGNRACETAYHAGAKVVLLPTIPFGVNTNHLQDPGGPGLQRHAHDAPSAADRPGRFAGAARPTQAGAAQRPRRQ